jgi:hypothetical protein
MKFRELRSKSGVSGFVTTILQDDSDGGSLQSSALDDGGDLRQRPREAFVERGAAEFEEEDLGGVSFVPLIGEQGWSEDGASSIGHHVSGQSREETPPPMTAEAAKPVP